MFLKNKIINIQYINSHIYISFGIWKCQNVYTNGYKIGIERKLRKLHNQK